LAAIRLDTRHDDNAGVMIICAVCVLLCVYVLCLGANSTLLLCAYLALSWCQFDSASMPIWLCLGAYLALSWCQFDSASMLIWLFLGVYFGFWPCLDVYFGFGSALMFILALALPSCLFGFGPVLVPIRLYLGTICLRLDVYLALHWC
jgi:hypothetical protein